jgi:hypothetical protein
VIRYAHVDSVGLVWSAGQNEIAALSAFDVDEFVDGLKLSDDCTWRIIGAQQNVNLIARLYQELLAAEIQLATPRLVGARRNLSDGRYSIFCAQQSQLPRSAGGWNKLSEQQASIYNLATYQRSSDSLQLFSDVISEHWFCKLLSFIPGLYLPAVAEIATAVLDPRWFIDPKKPDRCSALKRYLGISPAVVKAMLAGASSPLHQRCKLTHAAWYTSIDPKQIVKPGHFLHRILYKRGGKLDGWVSATNKFVEFFNRAWLDQLSKTENKNKADAMFLPELFFKNSEVEAYADYVASLA